MRFHNGQKLRIIKEGNLSNWGDGMDEFIGKVFIYKEIMYDSEYYIQHGGWFWKTEWLKPVNDYKNLLKKYDV